METVNNAQLSLWFDILNESQTYNQNLINQIVDKFDSQSPWSNDIFFYKLVIKKTPSRVDYHSFSLNNFKEISRKLINGLASFGRVTNRDFWKKYFIGGVKTVSIYQENMENYPIFFLNYLIYSKYDNLDVLIKNILIARIKMIDPTLSISFEYLGNYQKPLILEHLELSTNVLYDSFGISKLGEVNLTKILNNNFQRPCFLGELYKNRY
jgi:hypothetical protein